MGMPETRKYPYHYNIAFGFRQQEIWVRGFALLAVSLAVSFSRQNIEPLPAGRLAGRRHV